MSRVYKTKTCQFSEHYATDPGRRCGLPATGFEHLGSLPDAWWAFDASVREFLQLKAPTLKRVYFCPRHMKVMRQDQLLENRARAEQAGIPHG